MNIQPERGNYFSIVRGNPDYFYQWQADCGCEYEQATFHSNVIIFAIQVVRYAVGHYHNPVPDTNIFVDVGFFES